MRERNNIIMEYGTYMLVFLASYIASLAGLYYLSGILLMGEALYLYAVSYTHLNWQGVGMKELVPISRKPTAASRTGRQW